MKPSHEAYAMIKLYEGKRLESYLDAAGVWTIGYGQTGQHIGPGLRITDHEAEQWLKNHVEGTAEDIRDLVKVKLTQSQFDALVSLVYNIGIGAFSTSTMLRLINNNQMREAAGQFERWVYAGGKELPGLVSRRAAEERLFRS